MPNEFAPLLPAVCDIARRAGAAIMTVYATDFSAERKADGSPVTEADTDFYEVGIVEGGG